MATTASFGFRYQIDTPSLPPLPSLTSATGPEAEDFAWQQHRNDQWTRYIGELSAMIENQFGWPALAAQSPREEADVIIRLNPQNPPPTDEEARTLSLFTSSLPGDRIDLAHLVLLNSAKLARHSLPNWDQDTLHVHTFPSQMTPRAAADAAQKVAWNDLASTGRVRAVMLGNLSDPSWDKAAVLQSLRTIVSENKKDLYLYVPTGLLTPSDEQAVLTILPDAQKWFGSVPSGLSLQAAALGYADEIILTGNAPSLISDSIACLQKDPSLQDQHVPSLRLLHAWPLGNRGGRLKRRIRLYWQLKDMGEAVRDFWRGAKAPLAQKSLSPLGTLSGATLSQRLTENLRLCGVAGPYNSTRIKRPILINSGWPHALGAIQTAAERIVQGLSPLRPRQRPHAPQSPNAMAPTPDQA